MNPIDAVISWVDGYEPSYQQKLKAYCHTLGIEKDLAVEPTRIQQCNEIHYCMHSLFRFAPWIRTIYLVTNQQIPQAVLNLQGSPLADKIQIVDQNELLRAQQATTLIFNSISVEWLIWQIKGLSNQFLYLNDDFFLLREVTPTDFFRNDKVVLRGQWKRQSEQKYFYRLKKFILKMLTQQEISPNVDLHRSLQEKCARLAGWSKQFYLLPHAPFPLIKESFNEYLSQNPQTFAENIRFPFRDKQQVSSIPLITHLEMNANKTIYDASYQEIMINGACHSFKKIKKRLQRAQADPNAVFLCVQSLDQAPVETQEYIHQWLTQNIL
jgi:hypothetical protein